MRKIAVIRIRIITACVILFSIVLIGRLYQVQVHAHETYLEKGESQYVHTVNDLYDRGSIYFTTKTGEKVSAATVQSGYLLALDPSKVTDAESLYEDLKDHISVDKDTFITRATLPNRRYVEIEGQLGSGDADAIKALDRSGVMVYRNQWRYYPGNDLDARTVGFVGYSGRTSGEEPHGLYGLERYYDDILFRNNHRLTVNFFAELFSNLGKTLKQEDPKKEGDIVTWIEPTVARLLQSELQKTNDKWDSTMTGGIIINPQTGAIYALDAVPSFNLNDRTGATVSEFRNPLVEDVFEMGSIIKALTMASGLDSGAVTTATEYDDTGCLEIDQARICNYDFRARGVVPMQEVLNQSLNVGATFVEQQMGKDEFRKYFKALKLGSETGIDLPNETHGLTNNLDSPRHVEYATASFGQGIALTPIATVRALSALGNGGHLITPHIAKAIEYEDGSVQEVTYPEGAQVFSPKTSETISRMLTTVVDQALMGGTVKFDHYSVASKTGTAQMADPVHGGYYDDRYLHTFFGYFPSYDPQFLIFLYTVEPKGVKYASHTLTTPFINIVEFLINYYNIPPDR